jgi:hypothetical protein
LGFKKVVGLSLWRNLANKVIPKHVPTSVPIPHCCCLSSSNTHTAVTSWSTSWCPQPHPILISVFLFSDTDNFNTFAVCAIPKQILMTFPRGNRDSNSQTWVRKFHSEISGTPLLPNMGIYDYVIYQKGNPIYLLTLLVFICTSQCQLQGMKTMQMEL